MTGPEREPIITIDGPAGSGKSTTAREVARRLGFRHLDSGALYRALTWAVLEGGRPEEDWASLTIDDLREVPVDVRWSDGDLEVLYGDRVVESALRSDRVTRHVSRLAALPAVRKRLIDLQRAAGSEGRLVADGRDMGSVVFPGADLKVFLTADLHERARRRVLERTDESTPDPGAGEVEAEAARIEERDRSDRTREISPLVEPEGAWHLDTTSLSFEEQVEAIVARARGLGRG